jgi:O-antigen ligase
MSALVEQGFPGAAIWLAILVTLVKRLRANRDLADRAGDLRLEWLNTGVAAMLAVVIVAGLFSPQARTEIYVWILALVCVFDPLLRGSTRQLGERESEGGLSRTVKRESAAPQL